MSTLSYGYQPITYAAQPSYGAAAYNPYAVAAPAYAPYAASYAPVASPQYAAAPQYGAAPQYVVVSPYIPSTVPVAASPAAAAPVYYTQAFSQPSYTPSLGAGPYTATAGAQQAGSWSAQWLEVFQTLGIPQAEIESLSRGGYTSAQLHSIANALAAQSAQQPAPASAPAATPAAAEPAAADAAAPAPAAPVPAAADPAPASSETPAASSAPVPSSSSSEPTSSSSSPTPTSAPPASSTPGAQPAGKPGWTPAWEKKFTDLFASLGASKQEIVAQIGELKAQGLSEAGLKEMYAKMETVAKEAKASGAVSGTPGTPGAGKGAGAWSPTWERKFKQMFRDLKLPMAQQKQILEGLAQSGLTSRELQKMYDEQAPAWKKWENKFEKLGMPKELFNSLKQQAENQPNAVVKDMYHKYSSIKNRYDRGGHTKRLKDAGLKNDQRWGFMLDKGNEKPKKSKVDKVVDQMKAAKVPMWKRVANMAIDFIPGVSTLEYAMGHQLITGDKIDRSNPLNIGMAILSALPAVSWAKGGIQAWKGGTMIKSAHDMLSGAKTLTAAGKTANTIAAGSKGIGSLGGAVGAIEGAQTATALTRAKHLVDLAGGMDKAAKFGSTWRRVAMTLPIANRIGTTGSMYKASRTAYAIHGLTRTHDALIAAKPALQKLIQGGGDLRSADDIKAVAAALREKAALIAAKSAKGVNTANISKTAIQQAERLEKVAATMKHGDTLADFTKVTGMSAREYALVGKQLDAMRSGQIAVRVGRGHISLNPLKSRANVGFQGGNAGGKIAKAAAPIQRFANGVPKGEEFFKLGRGVAVNSKAGYAQVAGATLERVGVASASQTMAKIATSEAGAVTRSIWRLPRTLLKPGSNEQVFRAVGELKHGENALYKMATTYGRYVRDMGAGPSLAMMAGIPILTGQAARMVQPLWDSRNDGASDPAYKPVEDAAIRDSENASDDLTGGDEDFLDTEGTAAPGAGAAGVDPATGWAIDPQSDLPIEPQSGLPMDPQSGLLIDVANQVLIDPASGTRINPQTMQPIDAPAETSMSGDTGSAPPANFNEGSIVESALSDVMGGSSEETLDAEPTSSAVDPAAQAQLDQQLVDMAGNSSVNWVE